VHDEDHPYSVDMCHKLLCTQSDMKTLLYVCRGGHPFSCDVPYVHHMKMAAPLFVVKNTEKSQDLSTHNVLRSEHSPVVSVVKPTVLRV
jgi:hypothetical protein